MAAATIFARETQVKSLTLITANGKFPVSSVAISAAVGQLPSCQVTVMQGMNVFTGGSTPVPFAMIASNASVELATDQGTYTLMRGKIAQWSSAVATGMNSVQLKVTYMLVSDAALLDGIALGDLYFVSQVDGDAHTVKKAAFNESKGELIKALNPAKAEMNIASAVAHMIDRISADGKSAALGASLSKTLITRTCPSIIMAFPDQHPLADALEKRILETIGSAPVFSVYCSIIRQFFLEVVPDFTPGIDGLKMKVIPKIIWNKRAKANLNSSFITGSVASISGKGRNEVDGVAVKYTGTESGALNPNGTEDLHSTAVFAEYGGNGRPRLITNYEELRGVHSSARLMTLPLPYYVSYAMQNVVTATDTVREGAQNNQATQTTETKTETDWAKKWAEALAQMTFAEVNRSGNALNVTLPFMKFLSIRNFLGEVIAVEVPWKPGKDNMIGAKSGNTEWRYGYFQSWHLSIEIEYEKINFIAGINLIAMRSAQENAALGIERSKLYG